MTESWLAIFLFGHREYQAMKEAKLWTEEALGHEIASACRLSPLDSRAMAEDVFPMFFWEELVEEIKQKHYIPECSAMNQRNII